MLKILNPYNNIVGTTIGLIQHYKLQVTNATVNETIKNHPDYPSLLSISDSLNKWQIPNAAYKIEVSKLTELPCHQSLCWAIAAAPLLQMYSYFPSQLANINLSSPFGEDG